MNFVVMAITLELARQLELAYEQEVEMLPVRYEHGFKRLHHGW